VLVFVLIRVCILVIIKKKLGTFQLGPKILVVLNIHLLITLNLPFFIGYYLFTYLVSQTFLVQVNPIYPG